MLDLTASIIPGQSAGGYLIGMSIEMALMTDIHLFEAHTILDYRGRSAEMIRYRSASIDLWADHDTITQIGVHDAYKGRLLDAIQLGMTIDNIEQLIGPCGEDDEDNLCINGVDGLVFDVAWRPDHPVAELDLGLPALRFSPITWLYVYAVAGERSVLPQ